MTAPALSSASPKRSEAQRSGVKSGADRALKAFHEEEAFGKAYDLKLMRRLWRFLQPYQRMLWLSVTVIVFGAAASLVRPMIMREAVDAGAMAGDRAALVRGGLLLVGVLLFEQLLSLIQVYAIQIVGARAISDMRAVVFRFLHGLRLGYFDRQLVGRLVSRVTNDTDAILDVFASGAVNAVGDLVRLLGIVTLMLILDYRLALVGFLAVPPVALMAGFVRRKMRETFREIRAKTSRMNASMNEQVTGMTVIQAFGREESIARDFDEINSQYRTANTRAIKWESFQDAAIDMIGAVCLASIIVALGYRPNTSFGTVVAFSAYLTQFFEPISQLAQRYTLVQSAMAGAERVFSLLDVTEADAPIKAPAPAGNPQFAIEFEHVEFAYKPGIPVLKDLSFHVKPGEKIALVGPTGSGKTTITALLLRLYETEHGVVRVNGKDIAAEERKRLRSQFAVVPQDVVLFPGTVASNIAASDEVDRKRVEEVLRRMGALDLFLARPNGIDTSIDEQGGNFSAGERQLIAFARALYRDAKILILDEATAAVDSDTESRLQRALEELLKDRTAIIIAHRLSTIRAANRILVLRQGRLIEQGTHAQLIAHDGLYARLYELQFSRPVTAEATAPEPS